MNTPRAGPNIECISTVFAHVQCSAYDPRHDRSLASLFLGLSLLHAVAVLASAMAEGYSFNDRGPAGSGKCEVQRGSTIVATSS